MYTRRSRSKSFTPVSAAWERVVPEAVMRTRLASVVLNRFKVMLLIRFGRRGPLRRGWLPAVYRLIISRMLA
ncbi:MAG: hypothetical protein Phyf2KO_05390 [Phycisphaerales bacterium]